VSAPPCVVIGGGLAGVATAYELASHGQAVRLLEQDDGLGRGSSFANGGMITPSMSDPWNAPGVHRLLSASVLDPHSPMKLRLKAVPGLTLWGLRFLRNSAPARHRAATLSAFRLADYSNTRTAELTASLGLDYAASDAGTLKLFESEAAMKGPLEFAELLRPLGLVAERLTAEETVALEPCLADIQGRIAGALRYPADRSGDAFRFVQALSEVCRTLGVSIETGVQARSIRQEGGRVVGVETTRGFREASCVVLCGGADSAALAIRAGVRLWIAPAKGYSVTLPVPPGERRPALPVIDDAMHAAVVPLGETLRLVGTAEFTGRDGRIRPERIEALYTLLERVYPALASKTDRAQGVSWAGFRPMSADGPPYIGETQVPGLWVNAGHGHLGWTLAAGSAALLRDQILGRTPAVDPAPFRIHR